MHVGREADLIWEADLTHVRITTILVSLYSYATSLVATFYRTYSSKMVPLIATFSLYIITPSSSLMSTYRKSRSKALINIVKNGYILRSEQLFV